MSTCTFCGDTFDNLAISQCPTCRNRRRDFPGAAFAALSNSEPLDRILNLFNAALKANPTYLPGVTSGAVPLRDWYLRKSPEWVRAVTVDGAPVAHVSARINDVLPDSRRLTGDRMWEMGMFVVHPDYRRRGYATELAALTTRIFKDRLWATAHTDTPGHHMLINLGWVELDTFKWADDNHPGVALAAPNGSTR